MRLRRDRIWARNGLLKEGDALFVRLLNVAQEELFVYLVSLAGGDTEVAKECLQETNLRLWQWQARFDPRKGSFSGWAKAVALSRIKAARLRAQRANKRLVWDDEALENIAQSVLPAGDDRLAALNHCIKLQPAAVRKLLRRHYSGGVLIKTLAQEEGVSGQAMFKRFSRIRKSLADCVLKRLCKVGYDCDTDEEDAEGLGEAIEEVLERGSDAQGAIGILRRNSASSALHEAFFIHGLLHWKALLKLGRRKLRSAWIQAQLPKIAAALFLAGCGVALAFSWFETKSQSVYVPAIEGLEAETVTAERKESMTAKTTIAAIAMGAAVQAAAAASDSMTYQGEVPGTLTKLFENVSLADVKSVQGLMGGDALGNGGRKAKCTPWHFKNDGETLTVQFQAYYDYTKCVKLTLKQDGNDVYGYAKGLYVYDKWEDKEGLDFDTVAANSGVYTINDIELSTEDAAYLTTELWYDGQGEWNDTAENWLDSAGNSTKWLAGARACFTNSTALEVNVAEGISASHLDFSGNRVVFAGNPLELIGSGELLVRGGGVRFENKIAGESGLRCAAQGLWSSLGALTKQWQTVFPNAHLAGMTNLTATPVGGNTTAETAAIAYHATNDGENLTAQMQFYGGGFLKCVFLELRQNGDNVEGRVTQAKYYSKRNTKPWGVDFSANDATIKDFVIAEAATDNGYGMGGLQAQTKIELAAGNTYTGDTRIDRNLILSLDGGSLGEGTYDGYVVIAETSSVLDIRHTRQTFAGVAYSLTGKGKVVVQGTPVIGNSTLVYKNPLPNTDNSPVKLFENESIANWIGVDAAFTGNSMTDKSGRFTYPCFFRNDGNRVLVQFQRNDTANRIYYTKCAVYEFYQDGADIACRRVKTYYGRDSSKYKYLGTDWYADNYNITVNYNVSNLVARIKDPTDTAVTFSNEANYTGGITIDGAAVFAKTQYAIPSVAGSVCTITNHAKLFFDTGVEYAIDYGCGGATGFEVSDGSFARWCHYGNNGRNKTISAKGDCVLESEWNAYFSHLTLEGSTLRWTDYCDWTKRYLRMGYEASGTSQSCIKVAGDKPSYIDAPVAIVRAQAASDNSDFLLDVADVTSSPAADLVFKQEVMNYPPANRNNLSKRNIRKTGAGTVALEAANSFTGQVAIAEGTLMLSADNALNTKSHIVLGSAKLDASGSFKNSIGTLDVTGDGVLSLGGETQLSFEDSSGLSWTGTLAIELDGTLKAGMLRFGTDANALTAAQLSRIACNNGKVRLDANGYAVLPPKGTVIYLF